MLQKDEVLFAKSSRVNQSREWLGGGLFSQLDNEKHAAMRQTLNPAFRKEYLQQLDSFFVASAQKLAKILAAAAVAEQAVDVNQLFKRMTLDSIGLTNLQYDFRSLDLWEEKQQQQGEEVEQGREGQDRQGQQQQGQAEDQRESNRDGNKEAATAIAAATASAAGPAGLRGSILDVEQLLAELEAAFLWQSLMLPVPSEWVTE
jgi:cytochrome P450